MMQAPYLVIPILLLTTGFYLISVILSKAGILTRIVHRKIWNLLLLISFLFSSVIGLLLAVKANYRFEWPWLETMIKWHVNAGILMTTVTIIHLGWHLSYYWNLFKKERSFPSVDQPGSMEAGASPFGKEVKAQALVLGFFTMAVQVLLIREITTVFQGNEVMMAWTLAAWMFLTGLGSWLGRSYRKASISPVLTRLFILMAFLPPLTVLAMNAGKNLFFLPGTLVNPVWFIIALLVLLTPLCLLSGYTFALLVKAGEKGKHRFALIYALETAGSLIGGVAVSFLLIRWLSVMESLLITSLPVLGVLWGFRKEKQLLSALVFVVTLLILFFVFPLDLKIKSLLFGNQEVMATYETPYGNITVCANGDEKTIFENGSALFTTGDAVVSEEFVHYAMLQHPAPQEVLLISGDLYAMSAAVFKYPGISRLDYVEINPGLTELVSRYRGTPTDDRIVTIPGDGRRFIQKSSDSWDVIIVAVPDPSSLQLNRYYTESFMASLTQRLKPEGVVIYGVSSSGNYLSPEKIKTEASLYHTLSQYLKHTIIIPGERDYFIASDGPLSARPGELSVFRGIGGNYVNADYMDDNSLQSRGEKILQEIKGTSGTNTDLKPLPVFFHTLRYFSQFMGRNYFLLVIPLVVLLIFILRMNPVTAGMFVTGLTASSTEILLIFWFQVAFGNLYSAIGIIFALFMGGLAMGSAAGDRYRTGRSHFLAGQLMLAGYMLLLPLIWRPGLGSSSPVLLWLIFIPALLIPSFLSGFQFVTTTRNYPSGEPRAAASVYAADLWGSALGALVITTLLVPLTGVFGSCFIIAGLNLLVAGLNLLQKKRETP